MNQPVLSVVICTFNRDHYLQKCLDHLGNQTLPVSEFEVVVIDNNSSDRTNEFCSSFQKQYPEIRCRYLLENRQGLSFCRNRGIKESTGDIISYLDDDAYANENYCANLADYFSNHAEVDAIGGKITPVYETKEPAWMSKYLLPLVAALDLGDSAKPMKGLQFPIGANMAFRRKLFSDPSPFHTGLGRKGSYLGSGEEKELFFRLKRQGKIIHYVPEVHVHHFIADKRLDSSYIREMAKGIGESEALRIRESSFEQVLGKWFQEFFKIGATVILAISFILKGKWAKATMLVKFRIWFLISFIKG